MFCAVGADYLASNFVHTEEAPPPSSRQGTGMDHMSKVAALFNEQQESLVHDIAAVPHGSAAWHERVSA
jgi:hypothetical protein